MQQIGVCQTHQITKLAAEDLVMALALEVLLLNINRRQLHQLQLKKKRLVI